MCAACVRASLVHVRKAAAKTRGILVTDDILSDVYKKKPRGHGRADFRIFYVIVD